jgi:hypothetical protein
LLSPQERASHGSRSRFLTIGVDPPRGELKINNASLRRFEKIRRQKLPRNRDGRFATGPLFLNPASRRRTKATRAVIHEHSSTCVHELTLTGIGPDIEDAVLEMKW